MVVKQELLTCMSSTLKKVMVKHVLVLLPAYLDRNKIQLVWLCFCEGTKKDCQGWMGISVEAGNMCEINTLGHIDTCTHWIRTYQSPFFSMICLHSYDCCIRSISSVVYLSSQLIQLYYILSSWSSNHLPYILHDHNILTNYFFTPHILLCKNLYYLFKCKILINTHSSLPKPTLFSANKGFANPFNTITILPYTVSNSKEAYSSNSCNHFYSPFLYTVDPIHTCITTLHHLVSQTVPLPHNLKTS